MSNRAPLFFFGFVLLCCLAPMCGLLLPYSASSAANRAERLTPVPATILVDSEPGREVLVEGRVSSQNPAQYKSFVAYIREEREVESDDDGTPTYGSWEEIGRATPPLLLELSDGLVQIENNNYNLQNARTVEKRGIGIESFTETRYRGIEAGDHVIAVGTVVAGDENPQIYAEFIYRGTRAQYIGGQRSMAVIGLIGGIVFAVVGGILILWGLVTWLLPRRPWPFIR